MRDAIVVFDGVNTISRLWQGVGRGERFKYPFTDMHHVDALTVLLMRVAHGSTLPVLSFNGEYVHVK